MVTFLLVAAFLRSVIVFHSTRLPRFIAITSHFSALLEMKKTKTKTGMRARQQARKKL